MADTGCNIVSVYSRKKYVAMFTKERTSATAKCDSLRAIGYRVRVASKHPELPTDTE